MKLNMKKIIIILFIICSISVVGTSSFLVIKNKKTINEQITLNYTNLTINVNESFDLVATITSKNEKNKNITWSSSDNNIVSVDNNGHIIGIKAGIAYIYVETDDHLLASCEVSVNYSISYDLNGGEVSGTNLTKYNEVTSEITLINPTKKGYAFTGWTGTGLSEKTETVTLQVGTKGNLSFTANWEVINYSISYELNGGLNNQNNLNLYTIESDTLILQNPTRDYYEFVEWQVDGKKIIAIEKGSIGNITLTAIWREKDYTISYNLNNGVLGGYNPVSYTVNSKEIQLQNPIRNGYTFTGWTGTGLEDKTMVVTILAGSYGNRVYTANWEVISYDIIYELNGGINNESNISKYNIETETIILQNPTRDYYEFVEWQVNGEKFTQIEKGSTGNIKLSAVWSKKTYYINYNLNNGIVDGVNPDLYDIGSKEIVLSNPIKKGYEFIGWTGTDLEEKTMVVTIPTGSFGNRKYTANWKILEYEISYNLIGGVNNLLNPNMYTIESETITLQTPTKDYYEFVEWQVNGETVTQIEKGSIGNIALTAVWKAKEYTITFNLNNGTISSLNPVVYTINSDSILLINPTKTGYTFTGWTGTELEEKTIFVTIPTGSFGNRVYTANWETEEYTISYNLNGGINNIQNPTKYTIESETITLQSPTKDSYEFIEWQENGRKITEIKKGSVGNIELEAVWNESEYSISYDLCGGSLSNNNQSIYSINSESITLNNPTKIGYNFIGWTGTGLEGKTLTVIIPKGSYGNRNYTANWETIEYTISYESNGGMISGNNVVLYTIESENINLINPTKVGYNFVGWTGTDLEEKTMLVMIPKGSYGNRNYTANWEINNYSIVYELNGGNNSKLNPTEYTINTETIILQSPTRDYYEFVEWQSNGVAVTNIFKGSIGNVTLTAVWKEIEYKVSYELNEGIVSGTNPISYTVNSDGITLINPTKAGYSFVGWTGTGLEEITMVVIIPTGSYGNRNYTANWEIIDYTISYNLNGGIDSETNPNLYNITSEKIILNNPTKVGYSFIGWTGTDLEKETLVVTISAGNFGNRNYTANWEVVEYTISYNLDDGINNIKNPSSYTVERGTIILQEPTRPYYNFIEWQVSGKSIAQIESGSVGNIELTAIWKEIQYSISYELSGGLLENSNLISYNVNTNSITLNNPTKEGYEFVGWTGTGLEEKTITVTILAGSFGDREYTANWEVITYTISYELNGGLNNAENPTEYTIETETIVLQNPTREYFEFDEWQKDGKRITEIQKGSIGNIILTAVWSGNVFTIQYEMNGGENNQNNPVIYNIDSGTIILENPTKIGYTFAGWTGTDLEEKTMTVTILAGSVGDRKYTANWEATTYTIYYELNGGVNSEENPIKYTIESETIILQNPTKDYYEFVEWQKDGKRFTEITKGSFEKIELIAIWKVIDYKISYELNGGLLESSNLISYNINSESITLNNPTRNGYDFVGWTGTDLEEKTMTVTILAGSVGNREYTANWEVITYTISYELNGGVNSEENPTEYTIESETIVLQNPTKNNVEFAEWQANGEKFTKIEKGSTGNIVLTAVWNIPAELNNFEYYYDENDNLIITGLIDKSVTEIVVPDYTYEIAEGAFNGTSNLACIELPFVGKSKDVTSSRETAVFGYIFGNSSYEGGTATNQRYTYNKYVTYYIPNDLKSVTIKGGKIIDYAFYNCNKLTNIVISNNVISIGSRVFYDCSSLTNIIISESITSIGLEAFYGCSSLESMTLPFVGSSLEGDSNDEYNTFSYIFGERSKDLDDWIPAYSYNTTGLNNNVKKITYYIPKSLKTIKITGGQILNKAFYGCESVTNISIPNNVTSIGDWAFYNCDNLISVSIPNSVTNIGSYAFYNCSSLTSIYYNGTIEDWCKITFSNSSSNPMSNANYFYIMDSNGVYKEVTEIVVPNGVTSIKNYAFYELKNVTKVTIPSSVTSIGNSAFSGCSDLTSITIGNGAKSIGENAFSNCYRLVEIYNLSALKMYTNSSSYGNIGYYAKVIHISLDDSSNLVTSSGVIYYISGTEKLAIGLEDLNAISITIDNDCTEINKYAFYNCSSLRSVNIGNSVTGIGNYAFCGCSSLTSVIIPNSVTIIEDYAFSACSSLESITLPFVGKSTNLTKASENTLFGYIFGDKNYEGGTETKQNYASNTSKTYYIPSGLKTVIITGGKILYGAFYGCSSLTSIVIPNGVTSIGEYAFSNCRNLTSITIPTKVTSVGNRAFEYCYRLVEVYNLSTLNIIAGLSDNSFIGYYAKVIHTSLDDSSNLVTSNGVIYYVSGTEKLAIGLEDLNATSITIDNDCTIINDNAFFNCISLTNVSIGNSVKNIGNSAFAGCSSLTRIEIPNSVTNIGDYAFYRCSSLINVVFENTNGWEISRNSDMSNPSSLSSTILSDTSTAAKYLTSTYYYYYWERL